jgi:hypothetical protein
MRLEQIRSNCRVLKLNRIEVLFSYETPVAFKTFPGEQGFDARGFYGQTTTGHINQWKNDQSVKAGSIEDFEAKLMKAFSGG